MFNNVLLDACSEKLNFRVLRKFFIWNAFCFASVFFAASALSYDEIVANIVEVDSTKSQVSLTLLGEPAKFYRVLFDTEIRLHNKDLGIIANLKKGNRVKVLVNSDESTLNAVYVLAE